VDLRVVHLSGIWPQVYQSYLQAGRDGVRLGGMVSDFVLGSYVPSSKPKTKSDTWHLRSVDSEVKGRVIEPRKYKTPGAFVVDTGGGRVRQLTLGPLSLPDPTGVEEHGQ